MAAGNVNRSGTVEHAGLMRSDIDVDPGPAGKGTLIITDGDMVAYCCTGARTSVMDVWGLHFSRSRRFLRLGMLSGTGVPHKRRSMRLYGGGSSL